MIGGGRQILVQYRSSAIAVVSDTASSKRGSSDDSSHATTQLTLSSLESTVCSTEVTMWNGSGVILCVDCLVSSDVSGAGYACANELSTHQSGGGMRSSVTQRVDD